MKDPGRAYRSGGTSSQTTAVALSLEPSLYTATTWAGSTGATPGSVRTFSSTTAVMWTASVRRTHIVASTGMGGDSVSPDTRTLVPPRDRSSSDTADQSTGVDAVVPSA